MNKILLASMAALLIATPFLRADEVIAQPICSISAEEALLVETYEKKDSPSYEVWKKNYDATQRERDISKQDFTRKSLFDSGYFAGACATGIALCFYHFYDSTNTFAIKSLQTIVQSTGVAKHAFEHTHLHTAFSQQLAAGIVALIGIAGLTVCLHWTEETIKNADQEQS